MMEQLSSETEKFNLYQMIIKIPYYYRIVLEKGVNLDIDQVKEVLRANLETESNMSLVTQLSLEGPEPRTKLGTAQIISLKEVGEMLRTKR